MCVCVCVCVCACLCVCVCLIQHIRMLITAHTLQHTATHCNTLQRTATHRLQHFATYSTPLLLPLHRDAKQHTHCHTMQHTETHRKYTATHCSLPVSTLLSILPSAVEAFEHIESIFTNAIHCNTRQHIATRCNTLQHAATHYNTRVSAVLSILPTAVEVFERIKSVSYTATHCNTLQHAATRCNTLYRTRVHLAINADNRGRGIAAIRIRLHTATHGNTLQHTATHLRPPCYRCC